MGQSEEDTTIRNKIEMKQNMKVNAEEMNRLK